MHIAFPEYKNKYNNIIEFVNSNIEFSYGDIYQEIGKKYSTFLPDVLIKGLCGSNGMCAGNTEEEAVSHGICELFERLSLKEAYWGCNPFPTIPRERYNSLTSFRIIKDLEKKGYKCILKDGSISGRYPVVCLLLIHQRSNKVIYSFGADLCMDIAIQRCITEIFQGRNYDITFPMLMNNIYNEEVIICQNRDDDLYLIEYYNQLNRNQGKIPYNLLVENDFQNQDMQPFIPDIISNKDSLIELNKLADKNGHRIFKLDYSFLGFPTYRIFIPEISICKRNLDEFINSYKSIRILNKEINSLKFESELLLELITKISTTYDNVNNLTIREILEKENYECVPKFCLDLTIKQLEIILLAKNKSIKAYEKYITFYSEGPDLIKTYLYSLPYISDNEKIFDLYKGTNIYQTYLNFHNFLLGQSCEVNFDAIF